MNLLKKIVAKGPRRTSAAVLRRLASAIEPPDLSPFAAPDSIWSDYLKFVSSATGGWPSQGNIEAMGHAVRHRPSDAAMLEIGTFCGQSSCSLAYLIEKFSAPNPLFTCDIWRYDEGTATPVSSVGDSRSLTFADYNRFIKEGYIRNAKFFCARTPPHSIETDSDNFFAQWSRSSAVTDVFGREVRLGGELSFCFIDGNHSYENTRRDFENTDRFLVRGGFILFDDSADDSPWLDVRKVVGQVLASGNYQLVRKCPCYLLQKK